MYEVTCLDNGDTSFDLVIMQGAAMVTICGPFTMPPQVMNRDATWLIWQTINRAARIAEIRGAAPRAARNALRQGYWAAVERAGLLPRSWVCINLMGSQRCHEEHHERSGVHPWSTNLCGLPRREFDQPCPGLRPDLWISDITV